jgi:hypothetical protein
MVVEKDQFREELKREDFRNFVHQQQFFQWQFSERNRSLKPKDGEAVAVKTEPN